MRAVALTIFYLGVTAGAFITVREAGSVNWMHYGAAVVLGVVGVVLVRMTSRSAVVDEAHVTASMQVVNDSLEAVARQIERLNQDREKIGVYGMHGRIDDDVMADVNRFVEVRETIITVHGLETYARTMDAFASGERALNRAWSASADGYIDEVWACLERAERLVKRAQGVLAEQRAS